MYDIDKYSETSGEELKRKLSNYILINKVDFDLIKDYIPLYPDHVYRNIYNTGLMSKLI